MNVVGLLSLQITATCPPDEVVISAVDLKTRRNPPFRSEETMVQPFTESILLCSSS
jgi:hypothetical protein